jgi:hypothetical protein
MTALLVRAASIGLALVGASGCSFQPGAFGTRDGAPGDGVARDGSSSDGDIDGMVDPDSLTCFGSGASFTVCTSLMPSNPFNVSSPTSLDTDADCTFTATPPQGPVMCVRAATSITISSTLTVTGSRPLALLSTGALTITATGIVDAASHRGGGTGPGANSASCTLSTKGGDSTTGGGGGGGGSFGTKGGDGAMGANGAVAKGVAGAASPNPTFLRGGCKGGNGGAGGTDAAGGTGGNGGGAVYLLASQALLVAGLVNASGAGATASPMPSVNNGGGAGGGGSGGMIALYAGTTLTATGSILIANGGGGAEGGDKPHTCDPGDDPSSTTATMGGTKGSGVCAAGGDGGDGAAGTADGDPGAQDNEGGGGGGGGTGAIHVVSSQALTGAVAVSPPAS